MIELRGEKVTLIPLQAEHAEPLFKISHPDVWTYMLGEIKTVREMEKHIAGILKLRNEGSVLPFTVVINETGEIAGTTRLYEWNPNQRSCELGATWYAKKFIRTFVNTECKFLLLTYCFEVLQLLRVQIKTDERNVTSQRAIERLGAVKEGVLRNERILENGYVRNAVLYSIIREEWPAVKNGLLERASAFRQKTAPHIREPL